jgi:hypothetical protein
LKRILFATLAIALSATFVVALLSVAFLVELRIRAGTTDPAIDWLDQRQIVLRPYGLWTHPLRHAGTNDEGFRFHRDFAKSKPEGATRVAVFGGSGAWGTGVGVDQTFSAHMDRALAARGVPAPEVLNFGIGGFDSTTELIQLALNALPYQPDYVVVFDGWNDLAARRFVPHLSEIAARYKTVLDQANLGVSGLRMSIENALDNTWTGRPFSYLFRYSAAQEGRDNLVRQTAELDMAREIRLPEEEWSPAVYYTNLKSIAGVLEAHGIGLLMVYQPYNATLFARDGWDDEREPYLEFERAFFRVCREVATRCYSLDGMFDGPEVDEAAFLDIVHLSDFGNRVVGEVLADLALPDLRPAASGGSLPPRGTVRLDEKPKPGDERFPFRVQALDAARAASK